MAPFSWTRMLQCCTCISEHLFYRTKDVCSQKPMHKCLISLFIAVQNWKQLWCSAVGVKQTVVHAHHGIWHSSTQGWAIDIHKSLDESPENYAEWKRPVSKGYALFDSIGVTVFKWQRYRQGDHVSGCGGGESGSGCGSKRAARGILVVTAVLCLHCDGGYTTYAAVKMTRN